MATTTELVYRVWNDEGWGYEIGADAESGFGLEIRLHEGKFNTPAAQRMQFVKEDAEAIANAILKLVKE